MSSYTLSREADADVEQIARATLERWGWLQAERYVSDMHEAFKRLAEFPRMGRDASRIRNGYMRLEVGRHTAFYVVREGHIVIIRILHQQTLPERYL